MKNPLLVMPFEDRCCGCSACAASCAKGAITMRPNDEGFLHPIVDTSLCVGCSACVKVCPELNRDICRMQNTVDGWDEEGVKVYAAFAKDDAIRNSSTSGGLSTLLARSVIKRGGIVFGVTCDLPAGDVHFIKVGRMEDLPRLQKSKYVQANIGCAYQEVKGELESGISPVMFCGTPCQIAGLKHYLGRDYAQLLLVDIVCHAAPSPLAWKSYLKSQRSPIASVEFRSKARGWHSYMMSMKTPGGKELCSRRKGYAYLWGFMRGLYNRKSCDHCAFRAGASGADITLGDFWGIAATHSEMDDNRGTSLVISHTDRGHAAFEAVKNEARWCESNLAEAIKHNPSLVEDVEPHSARAAFYSAINADKDFVSEVKRLLHMSFSGRVICKLKTLSRMIGGK